MYPGVHLRTRHADAYDYQSLKIADTTAPERFHATYENAIEAIQSLKEKFGGSNLFGVEKDASFHSSSDASSWP